MARPDVTLSQAMSDRLDAARDRYDVDITWHDAGGPNANGRAFGFWRVNVGPYGWRDELPAYREAVRRKGLSAGPIDVPVPKVCTVEDASLERALATCLDTAENGHPVE